jgi:hypothetical protein
MEIVISSTVSHLTWSSLSPGHETGEAFCQFANEAESRPCGGEACWRQFRLIPKPQQATIELLTETTLEDLDSRLKVLFLSQVKEKTSVGFE